MTEAMTGLELLQALRRTSERPPNIGALLGIDLVSAEFGRVEFALTTRPDFANPLGTVHGGICATLLDSAMGCAVHSTLEAGQGYTTLELKVNYTGVVSTKQRRLTAVGVTVHVGGRTATAEGRVHDDEGRLVAHGTTTCLVMR